MSISFGNKNVKEMYFGSKKVAKVYFGNQLIWPKDVPQGNPLEGNYRLAYKFDDKQDKVTWDVIGNDQEQYPAFYGKSLLSYVDRYTLAVRGMPNPREHGYDWTDPPITENYRTGLNTKVPGPDEHSTPETLLTQLSLTVYPKDGLPSHQFYEEYKLLQYFKPNPNEDGFYNQVFELMVFKPKATIKANKISVFKTSNYGGNNDLRIFEITEQNLVDFDAHLNDDIKQKLYDDSNKLSVSFNVDWNEKYGRLTGSNSYKHTATLSTSYEFIKDHLYCIYIAGPLNWNNYVDSRNAGWDVEPSFGTETDSLDSCYCTVYLNGYNKDKGGVNRVFRPYLKVE